MIKTIAELKQTELADFAELPESYIQLQGMVETQYGAVKVVSNTWSAILDTRTCELCRSLDGKTLPEGHPDFEAYQSPIHGRCRCLWISTTTESPYKPPIDWEPPDPNLTKKYGEFIKPKEVTMAKPYSYKRMATVKDAEKWAIDKFHPIRGVDYKDLGADSANFINERMNELFSAFPNMRDKIAFWGSCESDFAKAIHFRPTLFAYAETATHGDRFAIFFNPRIWKNLDDVKYGAAKMFRDKWWSVGTVEGTIDHEFAHVLHDMFRKIPHKKWKNLETYFNTQRNVVAKEISRYAESDDFDEFWAELFAKYKSGKPIPLELRKTMEEVLKEFKKIKEVIY